MSAEYEQKLTDVKEKLRLEKEESIDQIRRQLQKYHTDEINSLIVDHQRELQRLQPVGETSKLAFIWLYVSWEHETVSTI